jgi:hypothetical protein
MDNIIHDFSVLPTDEAELVAMIHVSAPRDNTGGKGKSARIGFGSPDKIVYFQTPRVYCPFGTNVFKSDAGFEKLTVLITLKKDSKGVEDYVRLVRAMDEAVINAAFENQDIWFGTAKKDYKGIEIIRDRHHPLIQDRDMYDPQMKLKITEGQTRIYDKSNEMARIEGHDIPEKITGRGIVAFGPAWSAGGKFGVQAKCEQFMLIDTGMRLKRTLDTCLLKDDDDEEEELAARALLQTFAQGIRADFEAELEASRDFKKITVEIAASNHALRANLDMRKQAIEKFKANCKTCVLGL